MLTSKQHHILCKVSKDMNTLALSIVKQQISSLDKNLSTYGWDEEEEEPVKK